MSSDTPMSERASATKERFTQASSRYSKDIERIETLITSKFLSDSRALSDSSHYLLSVGGKRLRPLLTLMCAQLFNEKSAPQSLIDIAAGIELIHMATLLHDDIIDNGMMRRHHPSPLAKYGVDVTLLAGDFMFTRAFALCGHLDPFIIDATEAACIAVIEGEALEVPLYSADHTEASYLTIAKKKTSALFSLSAACGTYLATKNLEVTKAMHSFAELIGIAFQILDDILDATADSQTLGKQEGTDILERKPSLINIMWLKTGTPLAKRLLTPAAPNELNEYIPHALAELRTSTSLIAKAREQAFDYAERGRQELARAVSLASSVDKEILHEINALVDYTIERLS